MPPHWLCALDPVPLDYAHPTHGRYCLRAATLPDGEHKIYALTVQALPSASGTVFATATTTAAGATVTHAKLRLSITPQAPATPVDN